MSKSKKKINPRRQPASMADVNKAKREAADKDVSFTWALFFTVLKDKEDMTDEDLRRIWQEVLYLADSVEKGYVDVHDLIKTLDEEYGITLEE